MGDSFKRVQAGQRLAVSARAYNAMLETAEAYQRNKTSGGDGTGQGGYSNSVYVKNSSGSDAARFDVLGISDVVFSPADADALPQFKNKVVLVGDIPNVAAHSGGRFVICQEPIANGSIGRALAHGVCQVQINVTDESHKFADVKDGDHALLDSAESGAVSILWKESGIGTKWAVVRFGSSGSGAAKATWATVIVAPANPDPEADPMSPEYAGIGYYIVRLLSSEYAEWVSGTEYTLGVEVVDPFNNRVYTEISDPIVTQPTLAPHENTTDWEISEEIKIEYAWGYENKVAYNLKDFSPRVAKGEVVKIVSRTVGETLRYYIDGFMSYQNTPPNKTIMQTGEDGDVMSAGWK